MYPGTHARTAPDRPAVIMAGSGELRTYAQLESWSVRLARWLHRSGLRRGDCVALVTNNDIRAFEIQWAALRSGLRYTPVNVHLPKQEIRHIVNDCGAKVVIASAALDGLAAELVDSTPRVEHRLAFGGQIEGHACYEQVLADIPDHPMPSQPRGVDMLYTSGTTGTPKGVALPLPDHEVDEREHPMAAALRAVWGFGPTSVYLSTTPVYHAASVRFAAAAHALGSAVVVMEQFDAEQALACVERFRVTHSQWVPTMFAHLLQLDAGARSRYDLSSMRVALHAAAPCPISVKQEMIDWWGPVIHEYFGSTEGNGSLVIDTADWLRKPGSVGRDTMAQVRICGAHGDVLPSNHIGSVYFATGPASFEYHNAPERTAASRHPDHPDWTTTGDLGVLDEDGYLFLIDRPEFRITVGEHEVYPQQVESCLVAHPDVFDAAVIGRTDTDLGPTLTAVLQLTPEACASSGLEQELKLFARSRLADYQCPDRIEFTAELPRSPSGKLLKRLLVDRASGGFASFHR